jgi:hypothetical protein
MAQLHRGGIRTLTFARWEQRAAIVAAGVGSPWVAFIVWYLIAMWSFPASSPLDAAMLVGFLAFFFGPELVVYAGLVQKARGRAFWSDYPYLLWGAAIASGVLWVWVFRADVSENRQALLILASAVIVIASSVVGLIAAWQQRRLTGG